MRKVILRGLGAVDRILTGLFEKVQHIISNRYWAIGIIVVTVSWFLYETFSTHKVEGWFNAWVYTVFVYTILSLWIEAFQKVQTALMNKAQQEQMDRVEFVLRYLASNDERFEKMFNDANQKDAIIRHLIQNQLEMARLLKDSKQDVE